VRRATIEDVPALVALLADDVLGSTREVAEELAPYRRAFEQVAADPNQLLVAAVADGEVVGPIQLSMIPGLSRAGALRGQIEAGMALDG
jgi:uncharacterized membrane protein YdfJ with MMPL/SSD domain